MNPTSSPAPALDNERALQALRKRVSADLLGEFQDVQIGSLSVNYFSIVFRMRGRSLAGSRTVFVKIPKENMRGARADLLPLSQGDRRLALAEEASLRYLAEHWPTDEGVAWVKLVGTVPDFNALVTEGILASEVFSRFRSWDFQRRLGSADAADRLRSVMARLGAALGRFHAQNATPRQFKPTEVRAKILSYCSKIQSRGCGEELFLRVETCLESLGEFGSQGIAVPTLKGIDVRNVLIEPGGKLWMLDPGRMKITFPQADVARFLMTYRIVHWGSPAFLALGTADGSAEKAFLEAYSSASQSADPRVLALYFLKEQLKHWHTALDSLDRMGWRGLRRRAAESLYIEPFYRRQVEAQLEIVEGHWK